jgi:hypothetical protein
MFGCTMPDPLAMPSRLTRSPPRNTSRVATFTSVSVVMMASATGCGSGPRAWTSAGTAATIFPMGSGTPMTPVEHVRIASSATPSASASASAMRRFASGPSGPVMLLALPLFVITALADALGSRVALRAQLAARALDCVMQPAAAAGTSENISARSAFLTRVPAAVFAYRKPSGSR